MITDKQSIRRLQFRSDLPKFNKEAIFVFAQLEPAEQKLDEPTRIRLIMDAYAELLKDTSSALAFDNQLTSAKPLAYKITPETNPEFEILEALYQIETDRNQFSRGMMKIFNKTFVYFSIDHMRSIPDGAVPAGWSKFI